jgi:hypothetical protein
MVGAEYWCQLKAKPNQIDILRFGKTIPPSPPSKGGDRNPVQSPPFVGEASPKEIGGCTGDRL